MTSLLITFCGDTMSLTLRISIAFILIAVSSQEIVSREHLFDSIKIIVKDPANLFQRKLLFYANYRTTSNTGRHYFNDLINYIAPDMANISYKILFQNQKTFRKTKTLKLLLFEDREALSYFYQRINTTGNYNLSFNLMFISSITSLDEYILTKVFTFLYRLSILNIALLVKLSEDNIVMVTYFPFTPTSCHSVKPEVVNRYDPVRQQWLHTNYFPAKAENFYGCPVTCATWNELPYIHLEYNETDKRVINYKGYEGKVLQYAAENLNFTTKVYMMEPEEVVEASNERFAKIFSKSADISLCGYYFKWGLDPNISYSQTDHYYLSHTYLVTNVFNVYSTYEKIAFPFQLKLWYLLGSTFALSSLMILACECSRRRGSTLKYIIGENNSTPQYHLYTLAVGASMSSFQLPRYNFARFLLICWLLGTSVLRSAYQSGMYQMLRDNKQRNPPQTIADVIRQNYVILLKGTHIGLSLTLPDMKNVRALNGSILKTFPELLEARQLTAIVSQYEYFGYFGKINATAWHRLHLVNERIYTQQLAMNVRVNSYLVDELNKQIVRAQTFGLDTLWARESFGNTLDSKSTDYDAEMLATKTLSMNELGAVFMILLWSHLIAIAIFIIELMWHKSGAAVLRVIGKG